MPGQTDKTHKTAVVLIPPRELWEPIQAIRRRHDRQVRRWMPHVTLLYPFRPVERFGAAAETLERACRTIEPLEVELAGFRWFAHGRRRFTLWLSPEPADAVRALQEALGRAFPDCDDVRRFGGVFRPHLSVGQVRDERALHDLAARLESAWRPARFAADAVHLLRRGDPPDDVFRVAATIRLGSV
jgi:2'-5' RNA ligase